MLAMTCYVIALRNLPTATVSTYAYVNPVVAVALGWLRCYSAVSWSSRAR
jgi:drug/metabolite transporter (DMT)-like permease